MYYPGIKYNKKCIEVTLYLGTWDNRSIWEIEKPWENI